MFIVLNGFVFLWVYVVSLYEYQKYVYNFCKFFVKMFYENKDLKHKWVGMFYMLIGG